jgi:diguanylate cyclase (GGDEF)-like protein
VLVRRSVTNPLDGLAEQARRISRGELTDVLIRGPHEVRTVARALSSSVASLRSVEAQAAAVAAGDLDSPVVREALPGALGQIVHSSVASIISAINERELAQHELAHRAAHDALTDLPNRAQALVLVEQALHRAQRSSTKTALMFVDLDHFKAVNDNFGHATGDAVLQSVARRMLTAVRDGDSVARLGGDEFVVLLENISDEADIVKLAGRLVEQVSAEMLIEGRAIRIGASAGIAFCRDGYVDADRLLQEADAASYRAKNAGRGRVDVFDDGLRTELKQRAELEQAIATALDDDEFVLYYQVVIDLSTGDTLGVEALIRWVRHGCDLIPPDEFIPVAEQSTLINDIGRWVLQEATQQLARWEQTDPSTSQLSMAVNISGRNSPRRRPDRNPQHAGPAQPRREDRHRRLRDRIHLDRPTTQAPGRHPEDRPQLRRLNRPRAPGTCPPDGLRRPRVRPVRRGRGHRRPTPSRPAPRRRRRMRPGLPLRPPPAARRHVRLTAASRTYRPTHPIELIPTWPQVKFRLVQVSLIGGFLSSVS